MSLPPGFLDELRSRVSIGAVAGRKITWDPRKSNPGKGDLWAPCPFHQEKTASFHVDDRKGFYYCFGCHAKGDALSFVRETENVGFMEAVEILAREAGMTMPARDPQAQQKSDERTRLAEVMEQAVQIYRLQLKTGVATEARDYLTRRGLTDEILERFDIGFAPNARTFLVDALKAKGVAEALIVAAGLAIKPDDGGAPYDRFRGRIMFPIRDVRGRAIAFGGRAMDPDARAKYLNSNETLLFDKGRALYNHAPAREASGKSGQLVVAEGYMDVIALVSAGIGHAVAPLGTAITADQLQLMWRVAPEPVIALDGDTAGQRAAERLIDLALPLLEAGKSLRFCILPDGQDPDDLIKAQGAQAMADRLAEAEPMVNLLWRRETEGQNFDSPERRAGLDKRLRTLLSNIADPSLRSHYEASIREFRRDLFRPAGTTGSERGPGRSWRNPKAPQPATPGTKQSILAQAAKDPTAAARIRETAILAGCLNHPDLIAQLETKLERARFLCSDLAEIRDLLLSVDPQSLSGDQEKDTSDPIADRLGYDPRQKLNGIGMVQITPHLRPDCPKPDALRALMAELDRHMALTGLAMEVADAKEDLEGVADEGLTWRLEQASQLPEKIAKATFEGDDDTAGSERDLSASLQKMLDQQIWLRKGK